MDHTGLEWLLLWKTRRASIRGSANEIYIERLGVYLHSFADRVTVSPPSSITGCWTGYFTSNVETSFCTAKEGGVCIRPILSRECSALLGQGISDQHYANNGFIWDFQCKAL